MEYIQENDEQPINDGLTKDKLLMVLACSVGIDLLATTITLPAWLVTLGGGMIVEEVIEGYISKYISQNIVDLNLSKMDYIIGALPIPGVTAVSVKCVRLLMKMK